jgi:hypothetical protein
LLTAGRTHPHGDALGVSTQDIENAVAIVARAGKG